MIRRACAATGLRREGGETLVELLVTVSIMGIAFIAILAGIGVTYTATDSHRQQATAETVVRNYAERIEDPVDVPYVDCATTATYTTPIGFAVPATGWTATVTSVLWWQGNSPPTFATTSCVVAGKSLQQLTLTVKSPTGQHQATETVVIVKRKP